jgi:hypothetical protein
MKRLTKLSVGMILSLSLISGCASVGELQQRCHWNSSDRIDSISIKDKEQYETDLNECCGVAAHFQAKAMNEAAGRAIIGGLAGLALGAASGGIMKAGNFTTRLAGQGAMTGAIVGAATTKSHADDAFGNCMLNRGYLLLY